MKEKEKKIIEVGISLFAKKGYSATSIQEIVDACGMSKGAFYLYFKSKEALMLAAFKYQFQSIQARMDSLYFKNLSPRETFVAQLEAQLEEIDKNKEFIIMQIREQAIPLNSEIEGFIRKISHEIGHFYHTSLLAIYGDKVGKYVFDLNMILQGIVNSYVKLMMFDNAIVDLRKLATYILNRMDDLVAGYLNSNEEPILTNDFVDELSVNYPEPTKEDVIRQLKIAKDRVEHEDFMITLEVLEEEIMKDSPRIPVIQGMLGNIKAETSLQTLTAMIQSFFHLTTDDNK
jgi:AcrR family transcriptional regulator